MPRQQVAYCATMICTVLFLSLPSHAQHPTHGFIKNAGQIIDQLHQPNPTVKYLLDLPGGISVQLRANSFSYDTYILNHDTTRFHRVDIILEGAARSPKITEEHPSPQTINFYNATTGSRGISTREYAQITYHDIYPNIDLVFQSVVKTVAGQQQPGMEYNFIVRPGGNPDNIRLHYNGASSTALLNDTLTLKVSKGLLKEHIPSSYTPQKKVAVRYKTIGSNTYSFATAKYDRTQTLVIDPTPDLIWGTYYGGPRNEYGERIARDAAGNIYIAGQASENGLATSGAYQTTIIGTQNVLVAKFTEAGQLLWSTYISGQDAGGIAVGKDQNVVVTGAVSTTGFPTTPGAFQSVKPSPAGTETCFLSKFDGSGQLKWSTYFGGEQSTHANSLTTDKDNNIVMTGTTGSLTGIATAGTWQTTHAATVGFDAFLVKFDSQGRRIWGTYYGGQDNDEAKSVSTTPANEIVITGATSSATGIATAGAFLTTIGTPGKGNTFVSKFSEDGKLVWGTYYGQGGDASYGQAVCADATGNIYIGGNTTAPTGIATPGAFQTALAGPIYPDGFIAKFDNTGQPQWGTYCGTDRTDYIFGITTDNNNVWFIGTYGGHASVITPDAYQTDIVGSGGILIAKFDAAAGQRVWGTYYGKGGLEYGYGLAIVAGDNDDVYVTGATAHTDNIATCSATQSSFAGGLDIFVANFGAKPAPSITISNNDNGVICLGVPVQFTTATQYIGPNPTYTWLVNGQDAGESSGTFQSSTLNDGDQVQCLIQSSTLCVTDNASSNIITVHVKTGITPAISITASASEICKGASVDFTASPVNEGDAPDYQWKVNDVEAGAGSTVFSSTSLSDGDIITCKLTRHPGCIKDSIVQSNPITINVRKAPNATLTLTASADPICSGLPITFEAGTNSPGISDTFQWKLNNTAVGDGTNKYAADNIKDGDLLECLLSVTDSYCTYPEIASAAKNLQIFPTPSVIITGNTILAAGERTQLFATADRDNIRSYLWTPDNAIDNTSTASPVIGPLADNITYTVKVTTTDGCVASREIEVEAQKKIPFGIPSAFSPNNDGANDLFRAIYGNDISHVSLRVFNRWGQLMFEDNGTHRGWDGTIQGRPQPAGTYAWYLRYVTEAGQSKELRGTVILIR